MTVFGHSVSPPARRLTSDGFVSHTAQTYIPPREVPYQQYKTTGTIFTVQKKWGVDIAWKALSAPHPDFGLTAFVVP